MARRAVEQTDESTPSGDDLPQATPQRMMPTIEHTGGATAWTPEGGVGPAMRKRRLAVAIPAVAVLVAGTVAGFVLPTNEPDVTSAVPAAAPSTTPTPSPEEIERPAANDTSRNSDRGELDKAQPKTLRGIITKGEKAGTKYATTTVNLREKPNADSKKLGSLAEGDAVDVTSLTHDGWQQVLVDGEAQWVSAEYLTDSKPSGSGSSDSDSGSSGSGSSDSGSDSGSSNVGGSGDCPTLSGVRGATQNVSNVICGKYGGGISDYGGLRPGDSGKHGSGQAVDFMISDSSVGWDVANYLRDNASSLGVTEVIYAQKIWTTQRSSEGWRSMSDRGSATANHYDHVHVSVG